ncbi:lamin tail domain-containing protein [bacterium]|nr:lamin tail domain-containing protein [bacterium]
MRSAIVITVVVAVSVVAYAQIVVNEVMFNPSGSPENEWFELYNVSDSDVDLSGWLWSDSSYSGSPTPITEDEHIISAGGYVIVSKEAWGTPPSCDVIIPSTWRSLNNSGYDEVIVFSPDTEIVEKVIYVESEHGCGEDISLERIDPFGSSTDQSNWGCCDDPSGNTACGENSIHSEPVPIDLAITSLTIDPENPEPDELFSILVDVRNNGTETATGFNLYVKYVSGSDTTDVGSEPLEDISSGASVGKEFSLSLSAGTYTIIAEVDDTVGSNNTQTYSLTIVEPGAVPQIRISEIMFKPEVSSQEWIELFNAGTTDVDIANWTIADPAGEYTITTSSTPIAPGDYLIIAEFDTNFSCNTIYCSDWPWLNNSGDSLWLRDSDGNVVDQAAYEAGDDWDYGVSAEITSPSADGAVVSSWGASRSADGSTPCEDNSLWSMPQGEELSVNIEPNPFDPQLENAEIIVGAPADVDVQVHIYDLRGKLIKDFGSVFSTTWDGKDEYGNDVPTGAYILVVQTEKDGKKEYKKFPVAVARGMR